MAAAPSSAIYFNKAYSIELDMVKRVYRSEHRKLQAERTRQAILSAARRLFVTRGYRATTIEAIAEGAKVASQTVYAVFGSKRQMLMALLDRMAAEAEVSQLER